MFSADDSALREPAGRTPPRADRRTQALPCADGNGVARTAHDPPKSDSQPSCGLIADARQANARPGGNGSGRSDRKAESDDQEQSGIRPICQSVRPMSSDLSPCPAWTARKSIDFSMRQAPQPASVCGHERRHRGRDRRQGAQGPRNGRGWLCRCPAHDDRSPSSERRQRVAMGGCCSMLRGLR